jgi:hypothetical protein
MNANYLVVIAAAIAAFVTNSACSHISGFCVWLGLHALALTGPLFWQHFPWRLAAIHSWDWLATMLLMTVILGVSRR